MIELTKQKMFPFNDWVGEITEFCDQMKISDHRFKTYIYGEPQERCYPLRSPGATRGHIKVDEKNVIIDIVIYNGSKWVKCYSPELEAKLKEKYLGEMLWFKDH